jgi:hypothetical protein
MEGFMQVYVKPSRLRPDFLPIPGKNRLRRSNTKPGSEAGLRKRWDDRAVHSDKSMLLSRICRLDVRLCEEHFEDIVRARKPRRAGRRNQSSSSEATATKSRDAKSDFRAPIVRRQNVRRVRIADERTIRAWHAA